MSVYQPFVVWHKDTPEQTSIEYDKTASKARASLYYNMRNYYCDTISIIDIRSRKAQPHELGDLQIIHNDRMVWANRALQSYERGNNTRLVKVAGMVAVQWDHYSTKEPVTLIWTPINKQFPDWSQRAPWGGTSSYALWQLVRWVCDLPVQGIGVWKGMAGETYRLCTRRTVMLLRQGGWPEKSICVLCHKVGGCSDWWDQDDRQGPCCWGGSCVMELRG